MRRSDDHDHNDMSIGCAILVIGGISCIGGLLYFLKIILALITGRPIL